MVYLVDFYPLTLDGRHHKVTAFKEQRDEFIIYWQGSGLGRLWRRKDSGRTSTEGERKSNVWRLIGGAFWVYGIGTVDEEECLPRWEFRILFEY